MKSAVPYVLDLNEQMEILGNTEIADESRSGAAQKAHTSLLAVHLMLQDDAGAGGAVIRLLDSLRARDYAQASNRWIGVRNGINAGRLPG